MLQLLFAESAELYARSFYACDDSGIFDYSSILLKAHYYQVMYEHIALKYCSILYMYSVCTVNAIWRRNRVVQ